jgi:hypothetical protein
MPSKPFEVTMPAMPSRAPALRKSPASAQPFCHGVTWPPAAKKCSVVRVRRAAHQVMTSVSAMKAKKKPIEIVLLPVMTVS